MPAPPNKAEFEAHHRAETRFSAPGKSLVITFDSHTLDDLALFEKIIATVVPLVRDSGLKAKD